MFLSVNIIEDKDKDNNIARYGVHISKSFLNHILAEGFQMGEQLFIVSICSPYTGNTLYYPVLDIIQEIEDRIHIPVTINRSLNLVQDMFVDVGILNLNPDTVPLVLDVVVTLQAWNESFGKLENAKDKLGVMFQSMRILNTGSCFQIEDECVDIVKIMDNETGEEVLHLLTITQEPDIEIKITLDFMETKQSLLEKEVNERRKALEARGYLGEGHRLGTYLSDKDMKKARSAWLDKLDSNKDK